MPTIATHFKRQKHHTKLSPTCVLRDLTLREGIGLNDTITQAKQIDEKSKKAIFFDFYNIT